MLTSCKNNKDETIVLLEYDRQRWTKKKWSSFIIKKNNSTIWMEKEALGLKPANKQMRKELKNQSCSLLAEDVTRLSDKTLRYLQEELGVSLTELRNALLRFAVDSDSLKSELVSLLHKHGPYVWGKEDRNHLLKPNSSTRYEKDLFYDDENDREIWVIMKICNIIKYLECKEKQYKHKQTTGSDSKGLKRRARTVSANPNNSGVQLKAAKRRKLSNVLQQSTPGTSAVVNTRGFTAVNSPLPAEVTPKHQPQEAAWSFAQGPQRCIPGSVFCHNNGYRSPREPCPPVSMPSRLAIDSPSFLLPVPFESTPPPSQGVKQHALQICRPHHHQHILPPPHPHIQHQQPAHQPPVLPNASTRYYERSREPRPYSRDYPVVQHAQLPHARKPQSQSPQQQPVQTQHDPNALLPSDLRIQCPQPLTGLPSLPNVSVSPFGYSLAPQPAPAISRQPVPLKRLLLLQCDVTARLLLFFFPRDSMRQDETALFEDLRELWLQGESLFRRKLATQYDLISEILNAWLQQREAIIKLRHSTAANLGVSKQVNVERLLALNNLRAMLIKWDDMSPIDGKSSEDLLCVAFSVIINCTDNGDLFKDKLKELRSSVVNLLRGEDSRGIL
ncbi:hypothetical protein COCHEDRAFT_1228183 [Bipolaris maydis C5]|uniref:Uncharacterized protein n=1 Tax=Cochliobolus heterostrophus (strain C5 / ATCC 48332 / race O) TaxID=701091 RepID=M2TY59_COCH5|nr:hypothetical protein COCHEDRAFT_1228183 [Bipolaris maydis C5]